MQLICLLRARAAVCLHNGESGWCSHIASQSFLNVQGTKLFITAEEAVTAALGISAIKEVCALVSVSVTLYTASCLAGCHVFLLWAHIL